MVRRGLTVALLAALAGCERQSDMAESLDVPDSVAAAAMDDPEARAGLLDTMPGGEMAVGDSAMEADLLEEKAP